VTDAGICLWSFLKEQLNNTIEGGEAEHHLFTARCQYCVVVVVVVVVNLLLYVVVV